MEMIQINYEESLDSLPENLEKALQQKIPLFLNKLGVGHRFITIFFCTAEKIRALNATYRNKDKATDILSWGYQEDEEMGVPIEGIPWGELAICLEVCQKQADLSGWDLETELMRLIAHGVIHLQGYDHETLEEEKEMLQLELELLSLINLQGLYL